LGQIFARKANGINPEQSDLKDIHNKRKVNGEAYPGVYRFYMYSEIECGLIYLMEWIYKAAFHPVSLCDLN